MNKLTTISLSALLALSLGACGANQTSTSTNQEATQQEQAATDDSSKATDQQQEAAAEASGEEYTYPGIESWDIEIPACGDLTRRDVMATMAKPGTDMDAFIHSPLGEFSLKTQTLSAMQSLDAPEVAAYWADLGMVHESHDVDDANHQWTSLVPSDLEEGKTYPLLFVWHGHENPILMAEGYGFGEVAAEKDWIVVYPWANNDDDYLAEFDRILAYMQENYPVDASRIYTTSFSKGGRVSAHLALERADALAASAPCGTTAAASFYNPDGTELELTGPQQLTTKDFSNATSTVPIQFFGGAFDVYSAMPYDTDYKVDGVNGWLSLIGNDNTQSLEASTALLAESEDPTEKSIGLTFDKTEVVEADGTTYHIGSYLDADGAETFKIVECDGAIHWPTPYMGTSALDFLEQFTK